MPIFRLVIEVKVLNSCRATLKLTGPMRDHGRLTLNSSVFVPYAVSALSALPKRTPQSQAVASHSSKVSFAALAPKVLPSQNTVNANLNGPSFLPSVKREA